MSDVSRILRERAMAILRETRAKIDPALLAAMKEHLSAAMPQQPSPEPVTKAEEKFLPPVFDEPPVQQNPSAEAVDKQKIAQIVLNYMKHRESGSKH